jgi:LPXTG-motif cell wall-anchored protein
VNTTTTTLPQVTTTTAEVLPTLLTQVGHLGKPHPKKVLPKRVPPAPTPPDVLPFTGSDPSGAVGIAGVLMALGGSVMLAANRKRRYNY